MSSVLLDFNRSTDATTGLDFGTRSGTVNMTQPRYLDSNKSKAFRVLRVILSPEIPNIYTYGGYSNDKARISNDGGTTWQTVVLKPGIYTIAMMQDSLNDVANQLAWYAKADDPAIVINYNPATRMVYTKLDSTKLAAPGQIAVDFAISSMCTVLGYPSSAATFIIDGIHTATLTPKLDAQGTYVEVFMTCIQNVRFVNGSLSSVVCRIPIQSSGQTEIIWPGMNTGLTSTFVNANIPSVINSYNVNIRTASGSECVFLYGNVIIEVEIVDL